MRKILLRFFSLDTFCLIITYCHVICNSFLEKISKMSLDKLQTLCYNCHAMSNKPVVTLDKNYTTGDKGRNKRFFFLMKIQKKGTIKKMYSCMNPNEGIPARLYRSPAEIHRDMIRISAKIRENEEMLSVHNLLIEMIPTWAEQSPEKWLPELEATVAEALDALDKLKKLQYALETLAKELDEVRCMMNS